MKAVRAFIANNGSFHTSPISAAKSDFRDGLIAMFGEGPVDLDQLVEKITEIEKLTHDCQRLDTRAEFAPPKAEPERPQAKVSLFPQDRRARKAARG